MFLGAALVAAPAALAAPASRPVIVGAPEAKVLPTTAASYPYLDARHNLEPIDLAARGYEEVELQVSGKANVYDWAPAGGVEVKSTGSPYATRILVRRPKDRSKFSGRVLVEPMLDARSADWAMMWGYQHDKLIRDGDVWVGITLPKSTIALKKFDPARYAEMSFAPATPLACKTGEAGDLLEEGLRWDMIAQVGALLKSDAGSAPLAGYGERRLFMAEQGGEVTGFAVGFQKRLRLAGDKPIYDGYVLKTHRGDLPRLHHCGQTLPATDPRAAFKDIGVPAIAVITPGEVFTTFSTRRDDSDAPNDPFRRYEVAGGNHLDHYAYTGFPDLADQAKAGILQGTAQWPFAFRCTPETQLSHNKVMRYTYNAVLDNLAAWSKTGTPPPRAPRVALTADGQGVELDRTGMAVGGVRTVFSDMPTSVDALSAPGPGNCREIGGVFPLSWAYLASLYGTPEAYVAKALPVIDAMQAGRWITAGDAAELKAEIAAPAAPPPRAALGQATR
jgi:hypothetical protein